MKRLIAASVLAFAGAASSQTVLHQMFDVHKSIKEIERQCPLIKADVGTDAWRGLMGILVAHGEAGKQQIIDNCNQAKRNRDKPVPVMAEPSRPGPKGPLYGMGPNTHGPRDFYYAIATQRQQEAAQRMESKGRMGMVAPSFDCAKTGKAPDLMVCGNPYLSLLDQLMADAYRKALSQEKALNDQQAVRYLTNEQRKWYSQYQRLTSVQEIGYHQAQRIAELQDESNELN